MSEERPNAHPEQVEGEKNGALEPPAPGLGEYKIGEILERTRNERGLSLHDVEQATKIRKRYLSGLENEDYNVLPDYVYAQGFLKTYANFLGLDGEELSQELKRRRGRRRDQRQSTQVRIRKSGSERSIGNPGGVSDAERRKRTPATLLTIVVAVVVLLVVIGSLYLVGRGGRATQTPSNPKNSAEVHSAPNGKRDASGSSAKNGRSENHAVARKKLAVTVSLNSQTPTWIDVRTDGSVAYAEAAAPGFSRTFDADRGVSINTADAGAVRVKVNGQDLGTLGNSGETLTRKFTLKDAG